eukprot:15331397-Ditylum_brightwellii.AAC.1
MAIKVIQRVHSNIHSFHHTQDYGEHGVQCIEPNNNKRINLHKLVVKTIDTSRQSYVKCKGHKVL